MTAEELNAHAAELARGVLAPGLAEVVGGGHPLTEEEQLILDVGVHAGIAGALLAVEEVLAAASSVTVPRAALEELARAYLGEVEFVLDDRGVYGADRAPIEAAARRQVDALGLPGFLE